MTQEKFDQWALVEVFGHQRFAGRVTEQSIGGCSFVRVDVPAHEAGGEMVPAYTKLFGQGAIYSITPISEDVARAALRRITSEPLSVYIPELHPRPAYEALPSRFAPSDDDAEDLNL